MTTSLDILLDIAPEFADEDPNRLGRFIAYADAETSDTAFGDLRDMAVALLAAHKLTISNRKGLSGAISEMKEGELMASLVTSVDDKSLDTTSYGVQLDGLRRSLIVPAMTTGNITTWPTF